jgi:L-rhamnose mutarotase
MRICFLLKVRPDRVEEYRKRHSGVWPELRDALRATGWKNYSLFLRHDGMLVGYLEAEDFDRCCARMKQLSFFQSLENGGPDDNMEPLQEVFHLD